MKEKLDKFIEEHRNEFDDEIPSGKIWENVSAVIEGREKKSSNTFTPLFRWSLAAGVLLMVSAGVYFLMNKKNNDKPGMDMARNDTLNSPMVPEAPELNQFAQMIALKQEELKTLGKEQPELYSEFTKDINQLDSSYKSLKNQLSITPNREMLIEAMIQNLQLQLNVLNQQLNIIDQIKHSKKYSHEKINQSI